MLTRTWACWEFARLRPSSPLRPACGPLTNAPRAFTKQHAAPVNQKNASKKTKERWKGHKIPNSFCSKKKEKSPTTGRSQGLLLRWAPGAAGREVVQHDQGAGAGSEREDWPDWPHLDGGQREAATVVDDGSRRRLRGRGGAPGSRPLTLQSHQPLINRRKSHHIFIFIS